LSFNDEKKYFVKEKMEKKKAHEKAVAKKKPKGNGINDGLVRRAMCLCRSLLAGLCRGAAAIFAFAFVHWLLQKMQGPRYKFLIVPPEYKF
jgi:hypothetical protein